MTFLRFIMLVLGIGTAHAATPPGFLPSRDVTVSYVLSAPGRADASYQLQYSAAGQLARVNDPAHGTYFLANLQAGTAELIIPALHSAVAAPDLSSVTQQIRDAGGARFTLLGHGNYAGAACDNYLVLHAQGSGTACITPDGVVLHFSGQDAHGSATVTATSLAYGAQPAADFAPPAGFSSINLPPGALAQLLGQQ